MSGLSILALVIGIPIGLAIVSAISDHFKEVTRRRLAHERYMRWLAENVDWSERSADALLGRLVEKRQILDRELREARAELSGLPKPKRWPALAQYSTTSWAEPTSKKPNRRRVRRRRY